LIPKPKRSKRLLAVCAVLGIIEVLCGAVALVSWRHDKPASPPDGAAVFARGADLAPLPTLWKVAGLVRDQRGTPLARVTISLPKFAAKTETDEHGAFRFEVRTDEIETVLLRAVKPPAYELTELHVSLGNVNIDVPLRDKR